jgi:enterochelin esterase-like enzyme
MSHPDMQRRRTMFWLALGAGLADCTPVAAAPAVDQGRLERLPALGRAGIAARPVDVWLPPGFDRRRRYAALYMHDGQMLFDPRGTWNRKAWEVDRVIAGLLAVGRVRNVIVIGIHNDPSRRHAEFFPEAAITDLEPAALRTTFIAEALGGRPAADDYLRFLVEVVIPQVNAAYPVLGGRESTFIMGSSMGGLISLYALCEYPQVFGAAAALSTHWIGSFERNTQIPAALLAYLRRRLPAAGGSRIYMDRGTRDLDALYDDAQRQVDTLLEERGYRPPNFKSRVFKGATHDEDAWRARLAEPLEFLLQPEAALRMTEPR